jgi:hypothetical protein
MIIVDDSINLHIKNVTPKFDTIDTNMVLQDEISKIEILIPIVITPFDNYVAIEFYLNQSGQSKIVYEGKYYNIKLRNATGDILLNEKLFCTAQAPSDYSINNSNYVSLENPNNFIVYE